MLNILVLVVLIDPECALMQAAFTLAIGKNESIRRPFGHVPLIVIYNTQFDRYIATWILVNLVVGRIINVLPLHGAVGCDKKCWYRPLKAKRRENEMCQ